VLGRDLDYEEAHAVCLDRHIPTGGLQVCKRCEEYLGEACEYSAPAGGM
jgi:hypothetical protein